MTAREEIRWLFTDRTAWRWWFRRLVIQRLNGERKAAREYARLTRARCICCGTTDNLMWRRGDHELAVTTICRPCKFGACEECK